MNVPVKVKKLSPDAVIPSYKHDQDAGFDLSSSIHVFIHPGQVVKIPTGLAFDIPEGYEMQIRPRSGLSVRSSLRIITGTVDSGYHGEVSIIAELKTFEQSGLTLSMCSGMTIVKGERIAQAVISPVIHADFQEVDELNDSDRGENGFGSTGSM